jgi:aminopeptidase N
MEHQTLTTIGVPNTYIIAHELMHQWFGDHVTYATWGEMWLSEGFACFSEQLFLTHFWGPAAGRTHRHNYLNSALTQPCGQEYVTDTSGPNTLFYQPTVYYKGQGIVTMLRILAPTDSQFFQVLRNYQQNYAFGNGSVAEMNAIADSVYGFSLDSFFNEWIYGYGFPKYTITWNQVGTTVYVQLIQTPSCTGHPTHFNTPVELQLHSAAGDTIVIAYNTLDTQVFTYTWADTMSSLILNPDTVTICKLLTLTQDKTLGIFSGNPVSRPAPRIYPNPSGNYWQIDLIEENTILVLTDITGKVVWRGKAGKGITLIPGKPLPAGDYMLKAGNMDSVKLTLVNQ